MVVFCYAAKVCKMIKISKMDVLKIRVLLTASPLRGSGREGAMRAPTCANAWLGKSRTLARVLDFPEQAIAQLRDSTVKK